MTNAEFVVKNVENTGSTKTYAEKAVNVFLLTVTEPQKSGDEVSFPGLVSFEVTDRAARERHNPRTGEKTKFKASKALK
jgi:DNA-binding protein HU-beta